MKIKSVSWSPQFANHGVDAKKAHIALQEMREEAAGQLTAELIVRRSRDVDHVLHPIIHHLSNTQAAQKHRLHVARTMLRALQVEYKERPKQPVRAFEVLHRGKSGQADTKTVYASHEEAMKDPIARERLIAEAVRALMAWRRRFRDLSEFDRIFAVIDELEESFK